MYKLFSKKCICVTIAVFILLLIILRINTTKKYEAADVTKKMTRDYVLSDSEEETPEEHAKTSVPVKRNKVNIYQIKTKNDLSNKSSNLAYLKTWNGKKTIFVHSPEKDAMISARVRDFGTWEEDLLNATAMFIRRYSGLTFVDLGCNIGVYTLFVATLGVPVVAVDVIVDNLELLGMTLRSGRLKNNVTLVLNAISDRYQTVNIETPRDNIGGAHVIDNLQNNNVGARTIVTRESVLLDDLVPYINDKNVFIKMDIEGHEWNALNGGHNFFQTKNVKGVLMEWVHHRYTESGQYIIDFLVKEGLLPYKDVTMNTVLDSEIYHTWPENVFWIKR